MHYPVSPSQVQPRRELDPSPQKQEKKMEQIEQINENLQVDQFREDQGQEEAINEIQMDATQINLQIVKILQQMNQRMPQNKGQISQKTTASSISSKTDWKMISVLIMVSVIISSAFSVGICCTLIKFRIITINPTDNQLVAQEMRGVSEVTPSSNQTQTQTFSSNSFCGTINLNFQNGNTISNGTTTSNTQVNLFDEGWVYFIEPKIVFSFDFNNLNQNVFDFSQTIPKSQKIKYIKLVIYDTAGYSPNKLSYRFWVKTRVINNNKQWVHWNVGHRYWQDAVSFNSEELIVPCSDTREIRFRTTNIQNNGQLHYFITGYLHA